MLPPSSKPDIAFIPTPDDAIQAMLTLAELTPEDVVYDLGCGDGRLLIAAARQYGVRGVGVDVDATLLAQAQTAAEAAGVAHLLTFRQENLYDSDLTSATVVFLYLLPHLNERLRPRLEAQLAPGSRILSHQFGMDGWSPEQVVPLVPSEEDSVIYRWVQGQQTPAR